jgi:glycine hydroxymethyltransferase
MYGEARSRARDAYWDGALAERDPEIADLVAAESARQAGAIELIASENIVSRAVLEAQGSSFVNKTVEGVPGDRYHGGAAIADRLETLAMDRAKALFGAGFANVQPHSGSQANAAVLKALLKPGDPVLAMDLKAGGHLSHGSKANLSGQMYDSHFYGVRAEDGYVDYDALDALTAELRPKLIIAGGSSYPRALDLGRLRAAADGVGARLLVDMAHFAGLVVGGVLANPVAVADIVTTTTYKSLRGARGGMILWNDPDLTARLRAAVFPGTQGSPMLNMIAAKAVGLGEALAPEFRDYALAVQRNARALAGAVADGGVPVVTGGTDTPMLLTDLRGLPMTGAAAQDRLGAAGITCNKNLIAGDTLSPKETSGLRFGVSAMTTRGATEIDMAEIGGWIAEVLTNDSADLKGIREAASAMAARLPYYR